MKRNLLDPLGALEHERAALFQRPIARDRYAVPLPNVVLGMWDGGVATIESAPMSRHCRPVSIALAPYGTGWRGGRVYWGRYHRRRVWLRTPRAQVESLSVEAVEALAEPVDTFLFAPVAFGVRLSLPVLEPGQKLRLRLAGHGVFTALAIVEVP